MKVIITLQMNCTVTSFQKTGGASHPLGPMDATPMSAHSIEHKKIHNNTMIYSKKDYFLDEAYLFLEINVHAKYGEHTFGEFYGCKRNCAR